MVIGSTTAPGHARQRADHVARHVEPATIDPEITTIVAGFTPTSNEPLTGERVMRTMVPCEGLDVGMEDVGWLVGRLVGCARGDDDGWEDGDLDGVDVGPMVGSPEGCCDGRPVG